MVAAVDGSKLIRLTADGAEAAAVGADLAARLLEAGAKELLNPERKHA